MGCCRSEGKSFSLYIFLYKYPILVVLPLPPSADVSHVFIFSPISFRDSQECQFLVRRGATAASVVFTLWLLFLKMEEFPGRSRDVIWGIHLICPHSFHVFVSSGRGVLPPVSWQSYLLFLAGFERSQIWFPLLISHVGHAKAMAGHGHDPQPLASIQKRVRDSPYRLYIKGNSSAWVRVHIFPLELRNYPVPSSRG